MENFYDYTIENYTLSGEAQRFRPWRITDGDWEQAFCPHR